ncbi:9595_t:CDS:10 [Acaulospora morrowiae]|uniref:9595_t:CDS:1 n=1 Tax=Acaulospora morrowiae TaxID=94023 RepID=A0A9N8ZNL6_9GLOM|nr:9595_t:CDS:10 [Acaulospora morrowiae]
MTKITSVEVGQATEGETRARRSVLSPNELLTTPIESVKTVYDILIYSSKTYGKKPALGFRKTESIVEEEKEVTKIVNGETIKEKKTWKYFQLSGYSYLSHLEVLEQATDIGAGLIQLGLNKDLKLSIYTFTNVNWFLVAHGCFSQSITLTTAYDTLGEENILYSMNESEAYAIFTHTTLLPTLKKVADRLVSVKHVIYDGELEGNILEEIKSVNPNINYITLDEVKKLGKDNPVKPNPPEPQDICCIMYTSGSTGNPKGVMLTHANIIASLAGTNKKYGSIFTQEDTYLAYLPFAHVLEFAAEQSFLFHGITIGFGTVKTLTDASVRNCSGDIREFKPSIFGGVPAVYEMIKKDVLSKVNAASMPMQRMFYGAFRTKRYLRDKGLPTGFLDRLVFSKVQQQFGGRIRVAFSGGAPIFKETHEFITIVLAPLVLGYGMTENTGPATLMTPDETTCENWGIAGSLYPCVEIKLVDVPDAGYFSTNKPHSQGEVWLRGPIVSKGYFKNPKLTEETFTKDGWLQTGDIGEFTEAGSLKIIDRKKNLVKLAHGEYIALEKLESVYRSTLHVANICVFADSLQRKPVAVIIPIEARVNELAKENGVEGKSFEELCDDKKIVKAVLKECHEQAKRADLKPAEYLGTIVLVSDEWTPQNGLLTAANKLKRAGLEKKYKDAIDRMYADFGTTYSGFAYANVSNPEICTNDSWPGKFGEYKTSTALQYDTFYRKVEAWGYPALAKRPNRSSEIVTPSMNPTVTNNFNTPMTVPKPVELFKLHLGDMAKGEKPILPKEIGYKRAITDYLREMETILSIWPGIDFLKNVLLVLTVPAEFSNQAKEIMKQCVNDAGLSTRKLEFTTEPEAAAIYCMKYFKEQFTNAVGSSFLTVDIGGGTVDLTKRKIRDNHTLDEISESTGDFCGGSYVDKEFLKFIEEKIGEIAMKQLRQNSYGQLQYLVQEFCRRIKLPFTGNPDEFKEYELDIEEVCPVLKQYVHGLERTILEYDEWIISISYENVKAMFDPVVEKILKLIENQISKEGEFISSIFLVGGFSESIYLQTRIKEEFSSLVLNISVPPQPIAAVVRGGVDYGLNFGIIRSRVLKFTYGVMVNPVFDDFKDPIERKKADGRIYKFFRLAERGTQVKVNQEFSSYFIPSAERDTRIRFPVYITTAQNATYVDESGMRLLGNLTIDLPEPELGFKRRIFFSLTFGQAEIRANAKNVKTGRSYGTTFELNFLEE